MQERGISSRSRAARYSGLARHGLYYQPHPSSLRLARPDEARARAAVRRVAFAHVTYGHRRVWAMLRRDGWTINRKRVLRLMREERLLRPAHFPRPRLPATGAVEAPEPNLRWYTDLTYVDTSDRGPCPLTSIMDACTREILSWSFLPNCGAVEAFEVLEKAVIREFPHELRAPGVVLRTDAGSQFIAHSFREGAKSLGIELQAIRKKRPEDNGMIESYHGKLKMDYLWLREPQSFVETRELLEVALRHYNEERHHSSLNYLTPTEFAKKKEEQRA
ncbi:MAG: IS3 family transposase [Thermoplasmata archaeon]|nr:IS3 family transposase [Thermoplasmata archaeon]